MDWYPLVFKPIIKERIWGGTKLRDVLHKPIVSEISGESWELSTVPGDVSVIANGALEGTDLNTVVALNPEAVLGKKVVAQFGNQFPLLFKFLDAREDLSIQVHPNDALAKERHNSFGKTEMWYVMQADPGAQLIVGFKEDSNAEAYQTALAQHQVVDLLAKHSVQKGDVFFLETGTVHAIGAGTLIAEIQQTSDITYRIYDFDRRDAQGNLRELHTEWALEAINYQPTESKKAYTQNTNVSNVMVDCPYFTTSFIPLTDTASVHCTHDSFTVLMVMEGDCALLYGDQKMELTKGTTVLLPAALEAVQLKGNAELLEITIS
ncbi:type I phosphomannose isomerase catalytic subunit [Flavobacterium sp.]|jgi:mannose-6-phosphate isomerase|uniref:type I phosphomannose isomerase catalytic subunit n=1 Tax=Flavobacterium sp. TaxID=239 RepID=UPI0022C1DA5D|nr:type I phosphomannose isomerase catalytic subunit [Flavobacterium sp.]MCZ8169870.1 class I mannose-6-phosphate isomerase [Flavobacterium sp.]MCZ8298075.1 class I mannose-6-phosphate isomerase [Flavobacterium sp.]